MTHSMTAFARAALELPAGSVAWELRAVNHRYLEAGFRLPDSQRHLEGNLREALRQKLQRGKVECQLRLQLAESAAARLDVDTQALDRLLDRLQQVTARLSPAATVDPLAVLGWPGILVRPADIPEENLDRQVLALFDEALTQLLAMRAREGSALRAFIERQLEQAESLVTKVRSQLPTILAEQRQRLQQRLAELRTEFEPARLEQEMVLLAQRSDVAEELDRLLTHIAEVRRSLAAGGPCGRRLDFLMQELNREANTLSSKSLSSDTTQAAVDLKVLIEQMREQIQNIE